MHLSAVKRVMRYLRGTSKRGLLYTKAEAVTIDAYSDSDFGGDLVSRRSTSGWLILLSGNPITFSSRTQPTVAQSSTGAEFIAASETTRDMLAGLYKISTSKR